MGRAWLLSSLLHTALAVLLYFGLPSFTRVALVSEFDERAPGSPASPVGN